MAHPPAAELWDVVAAGETPGDDDGAGIASDEFSMAFLIVRTDDPLPLPLRRGIASRSSRSGSVW